MTDHGVSQCLIVMPCANTCNTRILWNIFGMVMLAIHHHSSLGSRCVPWLGEGLGMPSQNCPVLCWHLPYLVVPVFVLVVSPPLGWSPLSYFLVTWSPSGDTRGSSVVFESVDMSCPGQFHFFSQCTLYLWLLSSPWPRCWSFCLCMWCWAYFFQFWCVRPQVCSVLAWLVSRSQHHMSQLAAHRSCTPVSSGRWQGFFWRYPGVLICRPACRDSSLYLFVLVITLEAVVLSQIHVALDIFYQHIVHVYRGVVYNHHLCLCDVHLKTHSSTFIG